MRMFKLATIAMLMTSTALAQPIVNTPIFKYGSLPNGTGYDNSGANQVPTTAIVCPAMDGTNHLVSCFGPVATPVAFDAVNARAPGSNDDAAHGYIVGNNWQFNNVIYRNIQSATGFGVWQPASDANAPPADIAPSALWAAYGTRRLRAEYAGAAVNVVRASDGTALDIGFLLNGDLDTDKLDSFTAGTTYRIAIWYDQSGGGHNATAASGSQPEMTNINKIGNSRSIVFDTNVNSAMGLSSEVLNIPAGFPGNTESAAVITLTRFGSESLNSSPVQLNGSGIQMWFAYNHASQFFYVGYTGVVLQKLNTPPSQTPVVAGYSSSTAGLTLFNGENITTFPPVGAATLGTGGTIGAASNEGQSNGYIETSAVLIYNSITNAQLASITSSLYNSFKIVPQARANILVAGDSITFGTGGSNLQTYSRKMETLLNLPAKFFNYGYFGQTMASFASNFASYANVYQSTTKNNILTIFGGTNDIAGGATAAVTYANLLSFCQQARAAGWKIVVATMLPRNGLTTAQQTEWNAYNASIRANWKTFADALADVQADPTIGPFAASGNSALYFDGTHPTDNGYNYIAPIMAAAVQSLIR